MEITAFPHETSMHKYHFSPLIACYLSTTVESSLDPSRHTDYTFIYENLGMKMYVMRPFIF